MKPRSLLIPALALSSLHGVDIVGHRGASYDAPENTMVATKLAWKQNTDAVETDIFLSKDRKLTGLDLQHTWPVTTVDVKRIKDAGLELHVWTVNDVAVAKHWIDLGVASITTDRPGWLRGQLKL